MQPDPVLAPFVQCYWTIRSYCGTRPPPVHGVIPGGYCDIVFNIGGRIYASDSDEIFVDRARAFVVGPFDHFQRFRPEGHFEFFGVRFHLGRAPFSSQLRLDGLRNGSVPLDAVWADGPRRSQIRALELTLAQISGMSRQIACVEEFLIELQRCWTEPDPVVARALGFIQESKAQTSVEALASALRVNSRRLERKFNQHIGLSPKAFCRLLRFHRVKLALESVQGSSACDLACACGYYDQTHLIREFRTFVGKTPANYAGSQPVGFFLYKNELNC